MYALYSATDKVQSVCVCILEKLYFIRSGVADVAE